MVGRFFRPPASAVVGDVRSRSIPFRDLWTGAGFFRYWVQRREVRAKSENSEMCRIFVISFHAIATGHNVTVDVKVKVPSLEGSDCLHTRLVIGPHLATVVGYRTQYHWENFSVMDR